MKFIHTADIHYGMKPDANKSWSRERYNAIKEALINIVNECIKRNVDFLFISGDLFHRQPLIRDLKEVNYLFSNIPNIKVVIIAGNHDRLSENSAVLSFNWAANVHYITSKELSSISFPELNTEVYGLSYYSREIHENKIDDIKVNDINTINILLAHGGDSNHLPFDKHSLAISNFSYIALGHIHKHEVLVENKVAYAGSPEALDINETGSHGFYYGEVDDKSLVIKKLEFINSSDTEYISLVIKVSTDTTNSELILGISDEIISRGQKNIYKLTISGMRDPDIDFELDTLGNKFRITQIIDKTEPNYDFAKLFAEHPSDMIGFFVNELHREDMSPLEKKALYYGVNALLKTTSERS